MTEKQPILLGDAPIAGRSPPQREPTPGRIRYAQLLALSVLVTTFGLVFAHRFFDVTRPQIDNLHPKFLHHCNALLKHPPHNHSSRLESLVSALRSDSAATNRSAIWIAEPGPSAFYYTGAFSSEDWWLSERPFLIAISTSPISGLEGKQSAQITLLTPEFEKLRAQLIPFPRELQDRVKWLSWKEHESPYSVLSEALGKSPARVVVDGHVREFIAFGLRKAFGSAAVEAGEGIKGDVELIRERKDEREIGLLKCANQMTLHAIRKTRSRLRFGMTESQTRRILVDEMCRVGLSDGDGLVLFGENAALPHGSGTDRKLGKTDLILIDAGGKWGGYVADITRTFALPKSQISNHHLRTWETVRRAQLAARDPIIYSSHLTGRSATLTFADLDIAARAIISHSYPPSNSTKSATDPEPDYSVFTHRLGHGIGLEGHEAPYVVQGPLGTREVQVGHVFSLEPGIYIPETQRRPGDMGKGGKGGDRLYSGIGVRLEDCVVVREGKNGSLGLEWLSGPVDSWGQI